ncbi:BLUF domain-containing protein [Robbsia sp. Bb-Pol-6]|uniref:BLUF domain-containing protein n=1 Tax=Robbsia betulipollinis TaxID=2981849 RepID=A0ABT3ZHX4_9BURK|nr:BLUF domain-containing protein [Robbsia betulipollinis]MCY0386126.1 BLUF domain-containing protein [Robbsia betulipollinis]
MGRALSDSSHSEFCLLYISRMAPGVTRADVDRLVTKSIARNAVEGITGFLIKAGGHFVQYLEGPRQVVVDCFARMEKDRRHTDVSLVACHALPRRCFASWEMGYFWGDENGVEQLESVFKTWHDGDAALIDEAMRIYGKAQQSAMAGDLAVGSPPEYGVLLNRAAAS